MARPAIPIIDLAPLGSGGAGLSKVEGEVGAACRDSGFFFVVGHGIAQDRIDRTFEAAAELFAAPAVVKDAVRFSIASGNRGYIPMKGAALDPDKPSDLKAAFNIGLDLATDDPEIRASAPFALRQHLARRNRLPGDNASLCPRHMVTRAAAAWGSCLRPES